MTTEKEIFNRLSLLVGDQMMSNISSKKVIIFGVGGVGSWCSESLIRNGIHNLTIVDSDFVCPTNINRQLQATTKTIGKSKVEVLKQRLQEINPYAQINSVQKIYSPQTADCFNLEDYDYIVDAIDSLENKVHLIVHATKCAGTFFSSMGAALKIDPTKISVNEFWKIQGCPLARAIRKRIKKNREYPKKKFLCVYSPEVLPNKGNIVPTSSDKTSSHTDSDSDISELANHSWDSSKAQINGTTSHITAIFGFTLAGLVVQDIYNTYNQ